MLRHVISKPKAEKSLQRPVANSLLRDFSLLQPALSVVERVARNDTTTEVLRILIIRFVGQLADLSEWGQVSDWPYGYGLE